MDVKRIEAIRHVVRAFHQTTVTRFLAVVQDNLLV